MELGFLRDALLRVAKPYSHLYHADQSLYMERFILLSRQGENAGHVRLHHICTADYNLHMHDHPFSFYTVLLTGWYLEARPAERNPCFNSIGTENNVLTLRKPGSIAYRHACDRHKIISVGPDTWTLVFAGPLRQWWGFYTRAGKVFWRDYESIYKSTARKEA